MACWFFTAWRGFVLNCPACIVVKSAICMVLALSGAGVHAADSCVVPQELWDRPRTGKAVLAQAVIKPCIAAFAQRPASRLVIRHGAAAEQLLLAEELRAWLVALALDAGRIDLASVSGMKTGDPLIIEIKAEKQ